MRIRSALPTVVVLLAAVGVLPACTPSPVAPDATVTITGHALTATGQPLSKAQIRLYKEADFGETVVGSTLLLGSLGGVCLFPGAPAVCHKGKTATTNSSGAYTFTLKGSDTQGLVGNAATMDVVFADPKGGTAGGSTTVQFKVTATSVALPPARLWTAQSKVVPAAGQITVSYAPLSSAYGSGATYSVQFYDPDRGVGLWSQPASGGSARVDARVLEDRSAVAAVTARTSLASGVHAVYSTPRASVRPTAGAPPSRHRPCLAVSGTQLQTTRQTVCVATDGDLSSPSRLVGAPGAVVTGVVVDLGSSRPVRFVVARGVGGTVSVEVSADGKTYRKVGSGMGPTVTAAPAAQSARYVRVRSDGLDESLLTEVSVW